MIAADFLSRYPEFSSIDRDPTVVATLVQDELTDADDMLSDTAFGSARGAALRLVAAHRLSVRFNVEDPRIKNQNTPGVLAGQSANVGGASQQLAHSALVTSGQAWRADYSRSNYGLQYLSLVDGRITPARVVGRAEDDHPPGGDVIPWVFP